MKNKILLGDCLDKLKELEDNSVDSIVTDPPYGLSFMGKKWDYDVPQTELWEECLRVLKPGGYLLAFAGTRTQHRMAVRIEDAGFEIRDQIMWVYGSGFPKSHNIGKAVDKLQGNEREVVGKKEGTYANIKGKTLHGDPEVADRDRIEVYETKGNSPYEGWGTALKPAHEPIVMARKPLSEKTVAQNVLKWGTGGINIDGCRVGTEVITQNQYDRAPEHGNQYGNGAERKQNGIQTQTIGRFPANLIHDNSEEVRECFPETGKGNGKGVYNYNGTEYNNKDTSMFNGDKPQAPSNFNDSGNASRFFKSIIYNPKASKAERNKGCEGLEKKFTKTMNDGIGEREHNENEPSAYNGNNHPTVKPIALMEYLIKMVTPKGGTVLDPFMGSGSTGVAAKKNGYDFIGIEREEEYIKIAEARINAWQKENKE